MPTTHTQTCDICGIDITTDVLLCEDCYLYDGTADDHAAREAEPDILGIKIERDNGYEVV